MAWRALVFACLLVLCMGGTSTAAASDSGLGLLSFRVHQLTVLQHDGNSYSGGASWDPAVALNDDFGLRLVLGASLLKGVAGDFAALDGELLLVLTSFAPWSVELGPGLQKWGGAGSGTAVSANLVGTRRLTDWLSLFAGYSPLFAPGNLTHEFKLGAELSF